MTYYDSEREKRKIYNTIKTAEDKVLDQAGNFPNCKGLYPDCPEEPSLKNRQCRTCPKTDELEKPVLKE